MLSRARLPWGSFHGGSDGGLVRALKSSYECGLACFNLGSCGWAFGEHWDGEVFGIGASTTCFASNVFLNELYGVQFLLQDFQEFLREARCFFEEGGVNADRGSPGLSPFSSGSAIVEDSHSAGGLEEPSSSDKEGETPKRSEADLLRERVEQRRLTNFQRAMSLLSQDRTLTIFIDCSSVLIAMDNRDHKNKWTIVFEIYKLVWDLHTEFGIHVRLVWVPGHAEAYWNETADMMVHTVDDDPSPTFSPPLHGVLRAIKTWAKSWNVAVRIH